MNIQFGISGVPYRAHFTIGVQTFYVCEREAKAEAEWYVRQLRMAFEPIQKRISELEAENERLRSQIMREHFSGEL